jgi:UDPglucose 6-dehydrogenase
MRVAIVGTGYVGLVSGACFAEFGHHVTCIDKDAAKIAALQQRNEVPIYEPGLDGMVETNAREGRLDFTTDLKKPVVDADAVFIAVGTPSRRGDGHADLSYVYAAAREIAMVLAGFTVVVTKSTVPVGTSDEVERIIREMRPDADFAVVSNPEFLREGAAIQDFKHPDRIVIGTDNEHARATMNELYRPLYLNQAPILYTSRCSAELIKYAANAFLATKIITFINEIADLCEKLGADVQEVARGIGLDNRIGAKFLHAGPGFGGSCLPKDTLALVKTGQDQAAPLRIVETVVAVNDARKRAMARKVAATLGNLRGKTIAILGLTFKPNTDDMREAPSIPLLQDFGARVRAYDPVGIEQARSLLTDVTFCDGPYTCASGADAVVIVTEWEQFRALDLDRLKATMTSPVIIDLRNVYRADEMTKRGFVYEGVGNATHTAEVEPPWMTR